MSKMESEWRGRSEIIPRQYTCAHCERDIGAHRGYFKGESAAKPKEAIYICPYCDQITYFFQTKQVPSPPFGGKVKHLPDDIEKLYNEARECTSVNAFTATIMACRKILMHIAVQKEAKPGDKFANYVDYLAEKNYVPPGCKVWVERIRTKGNEANHEIVIMKKEDAEDLLNFLEMLLKFMYEFPGKLAPPTKEGETS